MQCSTSLLLDSVRSLKSLLADTNINQLIWPRASITGVSVPSVAPPAKKGVKGGDRKEKYPIMPIEHSTWEFFHVLASERELEKDLKFLVSKWAYLSHFMKIVWKYVGKIVIWWLFLNSRSHRKNGRNIKKPPANPPYCLYIGRLSCVTDLTRVNLNLVGHILSLYLLSLSLL